MDKLAAIRIYDGQNYSDEIPVTALAENIQWDESSTLIDILGSINLTHKGNIQDQIDELNNRINNIHDSVVSVNGKTGTVVLNAADVGAGTGNYNKPISGIPKTDLASSVQTSLEKADSALQSYTETDPTVPAWAKQPNKPTYTAQEVGALPADSQITVEVDDTLSIQGAAADAKAVGDALASNTNVSRIIASTYNDSNTYNIGSLVLYDGLLYRCRTKIETPEAWTRVHWDLLTIDKSLTPLELGQLWSTCNTAENTLDKVTSIFSYDDTQYNPKPFGIIGIYFYNAVPANSTLNINNTGAKPIYKGPNPIGDNEIKAGDTAYFMLNGIGRFEFLGVDSYGTQIKTIKQDLEIQQTRAETAQALKINKPVTNPNGTQGQILQTDGQGGTSWVDGMADEQIADAVTDWLDDHVTPGGSTIVVDDTLSIQSAAADAKKVGDEISNVRSDLLDLRGGVPANVRKAFYTLFKCSLFTDTGLTDEKAIIKSWADEVSAVILNQNSASISGAGTVQLIATTIPSGGTIVWQSSDESIATVTSYGLVTSVNNGTAIITASCGDVSASCEVSVSGFATLESITATYTQSGAVYDTDTLDSLKEDLVVVANYSDSSEVEVSGYTLSGELTFGTSTILVVFGGKTDTFEVTVDYGLPTGYTRYDYIKNTSTPNNSNVAVFTGLNSAYGDNNHEHYIEIAYDSGTNTTFSGSFGLRKQSGTVENSITIWQKYVSSSIAYFSFNFKGYNVQNVSINIGEKNSILFTYDGTNQKIYLNNELIHDKEAGSYNVDSTGEFALFKAQTGTSKGDASGCIFQYDRIYKYSVKNLSTGEYDAYMIPCKNSNGEAGFYDAIRENFYTAYGGASYLTALND